MMHRISHCDVTFSRTLAIIEKKVAYEMLTAQLDEHDQ